MQEIWDAPRGASSLGSYWFFAWASKEYNAERMVLVTKELLLRHPRLIPWDSTVQRRVLLHHFPHLEDVDKVLEAVNPPVSTAVQMLKEGGGEKEGNVHVEPNMPIEWSLEHREGREPTITEAGCGVSLEVRGQGVRGRNIG